MPRRRRPPVDLRPKDSPGLLGRNDEIKAVARVLLSVDPGAEAPVEIHAPAGMGKTSLLENLAHHPAAQMPDGAVYTAQRQPADDLLQFLFQVFYETDEPLKVLAGDVALLLREVRGLVELDDPILGRDDLQRVKNALPGCVLVIATQERTLWSDGLDIPLRGLQEPAALELLQRRMGRAFSDDELAAARALVAGVGGEPLRLVQAAARIGAGTPVADVAAQAAAPALPDGAVDVLAVLQAAGTSIGVERLAEALGRDDLTALLRGLEDRGLVRSHSPRYRLAEALPPDLAAAASASPATERAVAALTGWAERRRDEPFRVLEEADALWGLLGWAESRQRWSEAARLARALDRPLALAGRWGWWTSVMGALSRSSVWLGDRAGEAFAAHQLGTAAFALGDLAGAATSLASALAIREAIGDVAGAAVTRSNLAQVTAVAPPPEPPEPEPPQPQPEPEPEPGPGPNGGGGGGGFLRGFLWTLVVLAVIAGGTFLVFRLIEDDEPPPPPPGQPGISVNRTDLDFGELEVDSTGPAQTIEITSTGSEPLRVTGGAISGPQARDFQVLAETCSGAELTLDAVCTAQVAFRPTGEGDRSATLRIDSNAGAVEVTLSGVGVRGGQEPTPLPSIAIDPTSLVFSDIGQSLPVTVSNPGDAPLDVRFSLESEDPAGAPYALDREGCTVAARGDPCQVLITSLEACCGTGNAQLRIANTAGDDLLVPISGIPITAFDPPAPEFGDSVAEVVITNVGRGVLTIEEIVIEDDPNDAFSVEHGCAVLLIGESCKVVVVFDPPSSDTFTATLVVRDDSPVGEHRFPMEQGAGGVD